MPTNTHSEDTTPQEMTLEQAEEIRGSGFFSWLSDQVQEYKEFAQKHS